MEESQISQQIQDANILFMNHQYPEAIAKLESSLTTDFPDWNAIIELNLGYVCRNTEDYTEAKNHLEQAITLALAHNDAPVLVNAKAELSAVEAALGNEEEANRLRLEAQDGFDALDELNKYEGLRERVENSSVNPQSFTYLGYCGECITGAGFPGRWAGNNCIRCR